MPSKPNILIIGQSGSGKTCSLEQLFVKYAKDVAFIDCERKGLPFLHDPTKLGLFAECTDYTSTLTAMTNAKKSSAKIIVYDSFTGLCKHIRDEMKRKYTGWDIWNGYNSALRNFFEFNKSTERLVIVTAIDEVIYIEQAEGSRVSRLRCFVQGKEYEGKVEQEFLIVLFCSAKKDAAGKIHHVFSPHTDGLSSAKSPKWLTLPTEMPNDVSTIVDAMITNKQL
jgi:hypothetical protein